MKMNDAIISMTAAVAISTAAARAAATATATAPAAAAAAAHNVTISTIHSFEKGLTPLQASLIAVWICILIKWIWIEIVHYTHNGRSSSLLRSVSVPGMTMHDHIEITPGTTAISAAAAATATDPPPSGISSTLAKTSAGVSSVQLMRKLAFFGLILYYFYICDGINMFTSGKKVYVRDTFIVILLCLLGYGVITVRPSPQHHILSRDQTEEWKGWMQVIFILYHYFQASETYNAIRIFIACYVWMTGYGNFHFFFKQRDYSLHRVCKMLFRLNFLILFVCMVTNNQYMLYYICGMHTFWFLCVYVVMAIFREWNDVPRLMALKFIIFFFFCVVAFDVPGVGEKLFLPLYPVLQYNGSLHEWMFRAGLDHYSAIFGMVCAYVQPTIEHWFVSIEDASARSSTDRRKAFIIKATLLAFLLSIGYIWVRFVFMHEKFQYNEMHPYTSWIPIVIYIFVRNIHPWLREHFMFFFAWLGRITLETYIAQLHIYMQANAKELIIYIPGYPLLNWMFATLIYVTLSYHLFHLSMFFCDVFLPRGAKDRIIINHLIVAALSLVILYCVGVAIIFVIGN